MKIQPERIEQIIENFQESEDLNLGLLMLDARFLAAQMYPFSREVGELQRLYNQLHVQRKTYFAKSVLHLKETRKVSVAECERITEADQIYIDLYAKEYEYEARYEKGRMMFRAVEHTISRMNQEIAEMRSEKNNAPVTSI